MRSPVAASRYLPPCTFSAVLPLPNRSYERPKRGVMSLKPRTLTVFSNVIGFGLNFDVSVVPLPSAGAQLHARSYLTPPCKVSFPSVH